MGGFVLLDNGEKLIGQNLRHAHILVAGDHVVVDRCTVGNILVLSHLHHVLITNNIVIGEVRKISTITYLKLLDYLTNMENENAEEIAKEIKRSRIEGKIKNSSSRICSAKKIKESGAFSIRLR